MCNLVHHPGVLRQGDFQKYKYKVGKIPEFHDEGIYRLSSYELIVINSGAKGLIVEKPHWLCSGDGS